MIGHKKHKKHKNCELLSNAPTAEAGSARSTGSGQAIPPYRGKNWQESNLARWPELSISSFMLDWKDCPEVERSPDKVSGAWVFRGTRVPVRALFENLEAGAKVDDFLAWFEGVTRAQVDAVLEHASASLTTVK